MSRRVMVIGLDCAPPALLFDRFIDAMPRTRALMDAGTWAPLRSCTPPITVPAWTCMVTGRDPGELGLYGFRNRRPRSYELALPTSRDVRHKRLWDRVSEAGLRAAALFVPLTWPPTPLRGHMVSCFLTPSPASAWSYPAALKPRLVEAHGEYRIDAAHRTGELDSLLSELHTMAGQHFAIARDLWQSERPDFLMMVEMGPDRLHHAIWKYMDPGHPQYTPERDRTDDARRYYALLDEQVGTLLDTLDDDDVALIVSDHGARALEGGVCVNEWLIEQGLLTLHTPPERPTALTTDMVDWSRTRAWGEGGYYARIRINIAGREPEGVVPPTEAPALCAALSRDLEAMVGPHGAPLGTRVVRPGEAYRETRGTPPDLMAFFGDLRFRSIGTVGSGNVFTDVNDTGPDGCNHDWYGVFVMAGGDVPARGRCEPFSIYDVTPTVLGLLGIEAPGDLLGRDQSRAS